LQHNLQGPPQTNRIGEENALLDIEFRTFPKKSPGLPAGGRERYGIRIPREASSDARMQVKADCKPGFSAWPAAVIAKGKLIVPLKLKSRFAERKPAAVNGAEAFTITVMADSHA